MAGRDPVVELDSELPAELAVGGGSCLLVSGSFRGGRVANARLSFGGNEHDLVSLPEARFWGLVAVPGIGAPRAARLEILWDLGGGRTDHRHLAEIQLRPRLPDMDLDLEVPPGNGPLVAICMATYEPPADLLAR